MGDTEVAVEGVLLEYWHRMCASQGLRLYMIQRRVFFKLPCVVLYRNSNKRFPRLTVVGIEGLRLSFSLSLYLSLSLSLCLCSATLELTTQAANWRQP